MHSLLLDLLAVRDCIELKISGIIATQVRSLHTYVQSTDEIYCQIRKVKKGISLYTKNNQNENVQFYFDSSGTKMTSY